MLILWTAVATTWVAARADALPRSGQYAEPGGEGRDPNENAPCGPGRVGQQGTSQVKGQVARLRRRQAAPRAISPPMPAEASVEGSGTAVLKTPSLKKVC
jgi:hypothetical protein